MKGIIFVVSAPSGAGKTTLCADLSKRVPNLSRSISSTTRAPRPGERHGEDYYFVTDAKFDDMVKKNEFLEWAEVHGHRYGTARDQVMDLVNQGHDVLLNIDCQGAIHLKKKAGVDGVYIYILPPSLEALKERLLERKSDPPEEVARRLKKAREEVWSYREYYYLIVNDQFEEALRELEAVVLAERRKMKRMNLGWIEETFIKNKPDAGTGEV